MARTAVILICVFLAACAPVTAPLGLENTAPAVEPDSFVTRDGLHLPLRRWDAAKPRAVIVALHGMSDYSNAFGMPATWWAGQGITTYAYDQRGFGRAPNPGLWPGGKALRQDLTDCVEALRARNPGVPLFVLGESMGGAVVLSALAGPDPPHVDGVILVAAAVWSRDDMPIPYRVALWLTAHTVPWMHLSGRGLKIWPSDNIEMMRKLSRDPLFQKQTRADAVWGLVDLMDAGRKAPEHLLDAAHPVPLWRQGSDHSARAHRSRGEGIGTARRGARLSERLSHAAARPRRPVDLEGRDRVDGCHPGQANAVSASRDPLQNLCAL